MSADRYDPLSVHSREEFRRWLSEHGRTETECWVFVVKGEPSDGDHLWYLDAVEEALCFGWIDSTFLGSENLQRFSPRQKNSPWTELNKERVRRLEKLGRMTDDGRAVLPPMGPRSFRIDGDVKDALIRARAWSAFRRFPPLYQRVRAYNVAFLKKRDPEGYEKALDRLIRETKAGRMYGSWNDYGRLLDY